MPTLKMLAFDLDGTLLKEDKTISPATRNMLTALYRDGVKIAFVTGRMYHFSAPIQDLLDFPVHFICTDGAFLKPRGWEEPQLKTVAPVVINAVLTMLKEDLSSVYLLSNDRIRCFTTSPVPEIYSWGFDLVVDPIPEELPPIDQVEQLLVMGEEAKIRGRAKALDTMFPKAYVEIHPCWKQGEACLVIRPPTVDKGSCLKKLGGLLGVTMAETIAFGDWLNDLALFRDAGLAIAPANAIPEVKAKATIVSAFSNEQDFIVYELEKLLKEGKMVV